MKKKRQLLLEFDNHDEYERVDHRLNGHDLVNSFIVVVTIVVTWFLSWNIFMWWYGLR